MQIKYLWWWMIPVLLLGAAVHIHDLDDTALWADEGWTIAASSEANPVQVVDEWVIEDVHPPLYFILLNLWRQFTGDTIFEMRFMAVLVTLTGIAVMYRLGKALYGPTAGVLAALFFALHDLAHVLTQEVRHYSLQLTLTVLVMWLYWRFWQHPNRKRGIPFVIAAAALLWTHYWGGFVLASIGIHILLTRRQQLRPFIIAGAGVGLLFAPWLPALYHQITLERPGGLPHALENSWVVYRTLTYQLAGVPEAFWLVLALVGAAGSIELARRQWLPSPASLMPALIIVLTVGLSLLLNTRYPTLSFRSLAVIIPALLVLVAHTLAQFQRREQVIMAGIIVIHALTTVSAQPIERAPWQSLADFLVAHTTSEEAVLLEMGTDDYALVYYLNQRQPDMTYAYTETRRKELNDESRFQDYLSQSIDNVPGLWIAKFDWAFYDVRADLIRRGYVESSPPVFRGFYDDGRPIQVWRMDYPAAENSGDYYEETQPDTPLLALNRAYLDVQNDAIIVNLLWHPYVQPERPYFVSVFVLDENGIPLRHPEAPEQLLLQDDGFPGIPGLAYDVENNLLGSEDDSRYTFDTEYSTLNWEAGRYYLDTRRLPVASLSSGRYQIAVKVYYAGENGLVDLRINDNIYLVAGSIIEVEK